MTIFNVPNIIKLSDFINNYIKLHTSETFVARNKKSDIFDGILFRLLYSQIDMSQDRVASKLNSLKCTHNNGNKISRQAYASREKSIPLDFYTKFYNNITDFIDTDIYKKTNCSYEVFAVDGTDISLLKTDDLMSNNYKTNKNNKSITALSIGIFNVTYETPINLDLVNHKNERRSFVDSIKNNTNLKNNIYVFDRGFQDKSLFKFLSDRNGKFICRIKEKNFIVLTESDDNVLSIY